MITSLNAAITALNESGTGVVSDCQALITNGWEGASSEQFNTNYTQWKGKFDSYLANITTLRDLLVNAEPEAESLNMQALAFAGIVGGAGGVGSSNIISLERSQRQSVSNVSNALSDSVYEDHYMDLVNVRQLLGQLMYTSFGIDGQISQCVSDVNNRQEKLREYKTAIETYETGVDTFEQTITTTAGTIQAPKGYNASRTSADSTSEIIGLMSAEYLLKMDMDTLSDDQKKILETLLLEKLGKESDEANEKIIEKYFPEWNKALEEAIKNLKPGGSVTVAKSHTITFPDGSSITYTISTTVKDGSSSIASINKNLSTGAVTLSSQGASLNFSSGAVGLGVTVSADVNDSTKVKTTAGLEIDERTGKVISKTTQAVDYSEDKFSTSNSTTVKIPLDDNQPRPQPQPAPQPAPVPAAEKPKEKPWYEKGWDWVCDTTGDVVDWVGDHAGEIAFGAGCVAGVVITAAAVVEPTPAGEAGAAAYWAWLAQFA